jgi:hypothetical protein
MFFHESSKCARWDAAKESGKLRGEHGTGRRFLGAAPAGFGFKN